MNNKDLFDPKSLQRLTFRQWVGRRGCLGTDAGWEVGDRGEGAEGRWGRGHGVGAHRGHAAAVGRVLNHHTWIGDLWVWYAPVENNVRLIFLSSLACVPSVCVCVCVIGCMHGVVLRLYLCMCVCVWGGGAGCVCMHSCMHMRMNVWAWGVRRVGGERGSTCIQKVTISQTKTDP